MPVSSPHPEYLAYVDQYKLVRDLMCNRYKDHIIPVEYGKTHDARVAQRNEIYKERARFVNYTATTKKSLVGLATTKELKIEVPPELEYLIDSATIDGRSLQQVHRQNLGDVLEVGRAIMVVDLPYHEKVEKEGYIPTKEETKKQQLQPKISIYTAESFINWELTFNKGKLVKAVFKECREVRPDGYKVEYRSYYRVFSLDEQGLYMIQVFEERDPGKGSGLGTIVSKDDKTGKETALVEGPFTPRANGKRLDFIPITIIGSEDNNIAPDAPPLWPFAHINIGHTRNSADLEDNGHYHGIAMMSISANLSGGVVKELNKKPITKGAGETIFLPENAQVKLHQIEPNQVMAEMMKDKVEQLIMLGAQMITDKGINAPVATTQLNMGAKTSDLVNIVTNAADGLAQQIYYCGIYLGLGEQQLDSIVVEAPKEFLPRSADPAIMQTLATRVVTGTYPLQALLEYDQKNDLISEDVDVELLASELESKMISAFDSTSNTTSPSDVNNE